MNPTVITILKNTAYNPCLMQIITVNFNNVIMERSIMEMKSFECTYCVVLYIYL